MKKLTMYCKTIIAFFSFLLWGMHMSVSGQDFPYNFQTWDARNGLSSNFCNAICSDSKGLIYAGTSNGIYSFNGSMFNILSYPGREPVIGEGNVEDIIIDQHNRIWFASAEYGLGRIDLDNLNIGVQYFNPDTALLSPETGLQKEMKASKLCFDTRGNIWVGTRGKGLFRFDTASKKFSYLPFENPKSTYSRFIRSLSLYAADTLFVGIVNGLSILNPLTGKITHLSMQDASTQKSIRPTVRKIINYRRDSFLLATDRGTYQLQLSTGNITSLLTDAANNIDFSKVNSNDIIMLPGGELWIATENDGILFYKPDNRQVYHSWQISVFNRGIAKGFVSRFYTDGRENLWIAHQNGLSFFQSDDTRFYSYSFEEDNILAGHLLARENKLILARNDVITILDPEKRSMFSHSIRTIKRKNFLPTYVFPEKDNYLMIFDDSIFYVKSGTYASTLLPLQKQKIDSNLFHHFRPVKCIPDTINGKKQYLLLARVATGSVLLTYDPLNGDLDYLSSGNYVFDNPTEYQITNIVRTTPGKYWISTGNKGILYIDLLHPTNNTTYHQDAPLFTRIPGNNVNDILSDEKGRLWMLVFGKGLACLNTGEKNGNPCTLYSREQGLMDNRVYRFIKDDNHNFWITSYSGLFRFEIKTGQFLHYTSANGLSNIRFHINDIMMAKTINGYIGIADKFNELLWFKPEAAHSRNVSIVIKNISTNDKPVWFLPGQKKIFPPDQNSITFDYDIVDYDKTSDYKVVYKLDNYDEDWQTTEASNSQRYRQLPGNDYTFRIKLRFADGSYSDEQAVAFTVKTIWYKTWWFRVSMILAAAGLLCLLVRDMINRRLAKQKAALELKHALLLERSRISTELHDDIGGGLSTIRILSETGKHFDPGNFNNDLDKISSHSRELLQKMNEIVWSLNVKNDTLEQLITYIRYHTVKQLDEVHIPGSFTIPEQIPAITVEGTKRRHIQLLVKEAVNNITRHAGASFVKAEIAIDKNLVLTIHDNGKGIHCNGSPAGNGIHNIKSHAEAVLGTVSFENSGGTLVRFSVPLKNLAE